MPAYYSNDLAGFLVDGATPSLIVGRLTEANARSRFSLTPEAIDAWRLQLGPLVDGIEHLMQQVPAARDWHLLLEYPIPIVGKRIDAALLAHNVIVVIETKTGESPTSAIRQVEDYALNLACFHEPSAGQVIVPLVISSARVSVNRQTTQFDNLITRCRLFSSKEVGLALADICKTFVDESKPKIDAEAWNQGRFQPVPPIIDAAVSLYSNKDVFEIDHACSAKEDLSRTTKEIISAVERARDARRKIACFITGVPGAGKTLVGLNAVHHEQIKSIGSFLSGNGPLVKVIQEALIRDTVAQGNGRTRRQAALQVQAFIHNVHRFADEYHKYPDKRPAQNVVIFDEAQRAWDSEQNMKAGRAEISEPEMILEIMNRHQDWSVMVALVGGGQEINRGEAGLAEWGKALSKFPNWSILSSPQILDGGEFGGELDKLDFQGRMEVSDDLHLKISTRSIRAQRISDWVNSVLLGRDTDAKSIAAQMDQKPCLVRSIDAARDWLNGNRRGSTRAGLVGSASAARLRADGLESSFEFHRGFDWEHWFLDNAECDLDTCQHKYCNDVRASSRLEVIATQFEIQGLELDWVGVCWGEDFLWTGSDWRCRRFNNKKWVPLPPTAARKKRYLLNAYRVLMTRARQGMIFYLPQPEHDEPSRLRVELDQTTDFLISCGAEKLDEATIEQSV